MSAAPNLSPTPATRLAGVGSFPADPAPGRWIGVWNAIGILIVGAFVLLLAIPQTSPGAAYVLKDELGPVELATFGCFLAASFLAAREASRARRHNDPRTIVWFDAALAAFLLLVAMEEISWGQSLLGYDTPRLMESVNQQGELNLHNLPGIHELHSAWVCLLGLAGWIAMRLDSVPRWRRFGVSRRLAPLWILVTVMGAIETFNDFGFLPRRTASGIGALSESVELVAALACLLAVWIRQRDLRDTGSLRDGVAAKTPDENAA